MTTMDAQLPPAPPIDSEAMLEIFVHSSVRSSGTTPPTNIKPLYCDGVRLAMLGGKVLEAVFMYLLFCQQPMPKVENMESEFNKLPELVETWVEGYKWREKVRHTADVDLKDSKETRYLMDAYVGAVFVGEGFLAVISWVRKLVDSQAR